MGKALRAIDPRLLLVLPLLAVSLSGCDMVEGFFGKSKQPLPGERIAVFAERGDLEADKDMANVPVVLPAPVVNTSWPQSGGFANYAMHNLAVSDSPQVIWTADIGAGSTSSRILTAPPVVADGKVFVKDAQSTVSAFNADTGQMIWRVTLKPEKARDADRVRWRAGLLRWPAVRDHGIRRVFSLDPNDGKEVWNSTVSAPVRGAPLVFSDRVFAISIDNHLQALAAIDGSELWQYTALQESAGYVGGNSPAGSNDFIVAPFTSGELVALRIDNGRPVCERIDGRRARRGPRLRQPDRHSRPVR